MSFAWPGAWMFAALALPIILFYLIRQRVRLKPVSTTLFWQTQPTRIHNAPLWQKLRRLLSLLLQLLFLGLLVAALARPLWPGQTAKARSVILILDAGPTMSVQENGKTRWELLQKAAAAEIARIGVQDEAMLIGAGIPPEIYQTWTNRRADLTKALQRSYPSTSPTDLASTIALARDLAAARPKAEVRLLTDALWRRTPDLPPNTQVTLIGSQQPNVGITLFAARRSVVLPGEFQAEIVVEKNENGPAQGELQLTWNGQLKDVVPIELDKTNRWTRTWKFQENGAVELQAKFVPRGGADAWEKDNSATARLPELSSTRVALISEQDSYVEAALKVLPTVQMTKTNNPAGVEADLYIFDRIAPPPEFAGPAALFIRPPGSGYWGTELGSPASVVVSELLPGKPALNHVHLLDTQINSVAQYQAPTGSVLYARAPDRPVLFGNWERAPRQLTMAFVPEESDLVFRTAFPILISNLVSTARDVSELPIQSQPGSVATALKPAAIDTSHSNNTSISLSFPAITTWPLWWLALALGVVWLLSEWFLYTRRITE